MSRIITEEELRILNQGKLLKIQYGQVYIQIPVDDDKAIKFILDFLNYWIEILKKSKEQSSLASEQEKKG